MGIGVSLLLIAAGAILVWGVTSEIGGVDEDAIGVILMVIGALGLVLSLIFWSSWGGYVGRRRETYVEEGPPPPRA
jgi:hypothetical protein